MATVTIEVETNDIAEVSQIIRDSLGEFISRRAQGCSEHAARNYVEARYPSATYGWMNKDEKIREVLRRCNTAAHMLLDFKVTESHQVTEPA